MAYCSECGILYNDDAAVCSCCGRSLKQDYKIEAKPTPKAEEFQTEGIVNSPFHNIHFQTESQLGKGIIKPQKIELSTDGVHFKYDTPPSNFVKAEPVKEKPREYRVTNEDMESKKIEGENNMVEEEFPEGAVPAPEQKESKEEDLRAAEAITSECETISNISAADTVNNQIEPDPKATAEIEPIMKSEVQNEPKDQNEFETPIDLNAPAEPKVSTESKFPPQLDTPEKRGEPFLPEPEQDTMVIWEACQTWFRIPGPNVYRLTNKTLIILGKYNNKLLEVSLALITGIALKQSWLCNLLGIGNLVIRIPGLEGSKVVLHGVSQPAKVKLLIEKYAGLSYNNTH